MHFGILGAGAVGCYYGARLAQAGHRVTLMGRPAFAEAVTAQGLRLETAGFDGFVAVEGASEASALAGCAVILFCVKSGDTEEAGRQLLPHLGPDTEILSLQNGVDNAERLSAVLGRAVVPTAVYVASEMAGPGHVLHHGRGELVLGDSPVSATLAEVLPQAGIPVTISDTVIRSLWEKLVLNCAYNALSAVARMPYGRIVAVEGVKEAMEEVRGECVAVAGALGIALTKPMIDEILGLSRTMPNQFSSTAQDMARGKATEIDHLNGYVVRKGAELGVPTPVNRLLVAMVKLAEAKAADQ
ncbi:MAG: ketopantoate reductase family protein [Rhodospirillum sp.]|nr:ketopantoate reductase family protein [Rhodospirillum sp.]MCF8490750.1 ketopantoate reductase family protein [Rhodospirillum sp.]MCF8502304.1 ketopantoate reductase family protein [Rhodospirillum sp.]